MIRQLVQQVKVLQEKVQVLESERPVSYPSNPDATLDPVSTLPAQDTENNAQAASLPQELHELHGIQWRGFGEVDYRILDQRTPELGTYGFVPGSHGNFYTGDFDLLLSFRINDKASVLSEIVFGEEEAQKFGVDLERVLLKYDYNDHIFSWHTHFDWPSCKLNSSLSGLLSCWRLWRVSPRSLHSQALWQSWSTRRIPSIT